MADAMSQDEFEERYARLSGMTVDELRSYMHAEPCDCGDDGCGGWAMVS